MVTPESASISAGFRGAVWDPDRVPDGVSISVHALRTSDGATNSGLLYSRGGERTVMMVMHPREFTLGHYVVPEVLRAGCACWKQGSRSPGNDIRLEHELALLDVAAGVQFLRNRGFEKIILVGNSGGASLFAFYNQQALLEPQLRISHTPGGRPTKLSQSSMPHPDGIVLLAPHPGQGMLLMNSIDPSVTDESNPLSTNDSLSPFNKANGFSDPPESSAYSDDFVTKYRRAQRDRVSRIDASCKGLIAEQQSARKKLLTTQDYSVRIRAAYRPIITVWRTDADLRCLDLKLDRSERSYGSLWGADPIKSNYGSVGFGRVCTPESWLSTWSGLSSNAALTKTLPSIEQPTLFVSYTGDNSVFPSDTRNMFERVAAGDKSEFSIPGNHHGRALKAGQPDGRRMFGNILRDWVSDRFPTVEPVPDKVEK